MFNDNQQVGKMLILAGIVLLVTGIIFIFFNKISLGRLPGDIYIKKENFSFYFPLTTSILASILITIILYIVRKL